MWTSELQASVTFGGRQCFRYEAFRSLDGFDSRVCRGSTSTDSNSSYFFLKSPSETPSLQACQQLCTETQGCKGIEFRGGWCELWTRPGGIQAVALSLNASCLRYEPFLAVDGGLDRACAGDSPSDVWESYFTLALGLSVWECRDLCLATWNCKGIGFMDARCEIWTRPAGIGSSSARPGHLCLRLETELTVDAFLGFQGGQGRSCRGAHDADEDASYYIWHGPAKAPTLEECKALCADTATCRGLDFSDLGCKLWKREISASAAVEGATCLIFEPFQPVDGGEDRDCGDGFETSEPAASLQACKCSCQSRSGCMGLTFNGTACHLWTSPISSSTPLVGSSCLRYEPFIDVNGDQDQSCRGGHSFDLAISYYQSSPETTLAACKARCAGTEGCKGVDFSRSSCQLWTRSNGIGTSVPQPPGHEKQL